MSGNRQSSGSGAAVRVKKEGAKRERGLEKRTIFLDREELSTVRRNVHVLNGRPDVIRDFLQGFRKKFPYSEIITVEIMEQVVQCIRGEESQVILQMEKPPPLSSVFKMRINKDEA